MFGGHVPAKTAGKGHHRKLALAGLLAFAASVVAFGLGFGPAGAVLTVLSLALMIGALVLFVLSGFFELVRSLRSWPWLRLLSLLIVLVAAAGVCLVTSRFVGGLLLCAIGAATFLREASSPDHRFSVGTLVILAGMIGMLVGGFERALFAPGQAGNLRAQQALRFAILLCAIAPFQLVALRSFDQLVQLQHNRFPVEWENDGGPSGCYWRAPHARFGAWSPASRRLFRAWLSGTPRWMDGDPEALRLAQRLRICTLVSSIGLVAGFILCLTA